MFVQVQQFPVVSRESLVGGWRKQKQNKAELCSKRGSDEKVAINRRAMRRSNSWKEATWKLSSDLPRECLSRGAQSHQPVTLKIVKSMDRTKELSCRRQY